jgi:2-polyprenyl-3-methyl-5-hydroxy-6-metoxy-1,4-benzoquinol methylase
MEAMPQCLLCKTPGIIFYEGLEDRLFGVPGKFNLSQCPECGFVWLNPRPIREDIGKCYTEYYTHEPPPAAGSVGSPRPPSQFRSKVRRLILEAYYNWPQPRSGNLIRTFMGRLLGAIPLLRRKATYYLDAMFLPWHGKGRFLDAGCGNGAYLAQIRKAGWHVIGIDVDRQAAKIATQRYGVPVVVGRLEETAFADASFDAITTSHVIEHVIEPMALLKECHRLLTPGGHLLILTPNVRSLGHYFFRHWWRGLEPPRHLHLWHKAALRQYVEAAGFRIIRCFTQSSMAASIYDASQQIRKTGKAVVNSAALSRAARFFQWQERLLLFFNPNLGEEICILARKE